MKLTVTPFFLSLLLIATGSITSLAMAQTAAAPANTAASAAKPTTPSECDTLAKQLFTKIHGEGKQTLKSGRTVAANYSSHYSPARKACLMQLENRIPAHAQGPEISFLSVKDISATPFKPLAELTVVKGAVKQCSVAGKSCTSATDWKAQAAGLMKS
jgi:hypothetical protein